MHHCQDFTRTELLRQAAQAGKGLPAIEPGMPLPAGTGMSRRLFLSRAAGVGLTVYGAGRLSAAALNHGIAQAAASTGPADRVLVSVFLEGGADSLSILFPATDPRYRQLRPRLALAPSAGTAFPGDPRLRWHPSATGLATLHREGKVAVLPAIGYGSPDQSHFTSRHFYEVGATDAGVGTGWLGRYLDRVGAPDNPVQGVSLGFQLAPPLATKRAPVAVMDLPERYRYQLRGAPEAIGERALATLAAMGTSLRGADDALGRVSDIIAETAPMRQHLGAVGAAAPASGYPQSADPFPQRMASIPAMLAAGLPVRCVAVKAIGNYDTHGAQPEALSGMLKVTADTLLAFQRDLEARGLADRVVVHVWSEFGRRAAENGSLGTDHGAAGIGFLIGTSVVNAVVGDYPDLGRLDEHGNLVPTVDFRAVYSALVEQWLGTDATDIIPGAAGFARPTLIR